MHARLILGVALGLLSACGSARPIPTETQVADLCPGEDEDLDAFQDDDGCADPDCDDCCASFEQLPIVFFRGDAAIAQLAIPRIDHAAGELGIRPTITHVELVGHAPDGDEAVGRARAEAVRDALVARGIAAERLSIAPPDTSGTRPSVELRVPSGDCPGGG